jgi:predicted nucleotidyltransferase component of viral defense system
MENAVYQEKSVKQSELLQVLLLDAVYAQKGSEKIIFQGGTALRWVFNGQRFSEDLDFVTLLPPQAIENILRKTTSIARKICTAQFGTGRAEFQIKPSRETAFKAFFVYRPESQRERIAVKLELELLKGDRRPDAERHILRDLPLVAGLIRGGDLILPYASSLILAETLEEILSDKIRALFERNYLKGRDIYDIWWLVHQMGVKPDWNRTRNKLSMYGMRFIPARPAGHFLTDAAENEVRAAIESDLPRFLPAAIYREYQKDKFRQLLETLKQVTVELQGQGMENDALADRG